MRRRKNSLPSGLRPTHFIRSTPSERVKQRQRRIARSSLSIHRPSHSKCRAALCVLRLQPHWRRPVHSVPCPIRALHFWRRGLLVVELYLCTARHDLHSLPCLGRDGVAVAQLPSRCMATCVIHHCIFIVCECDWPPRLGRLVHLSKPSGTDASPHIFRPISPSIFLFPPTDCIFLFAAPSHLPQQTGYWNSLPLMGGIVLSAFVALLSLVYHQNFDCK